MTSTGGLWNNSYPMLRVLFLIVFLHSTVLNHAQVIVDDCSKAPGRDAVGSLTTLSSNLIVDGESPRYKRGRNGIGYLSYITQHGFLQLEVTGFVFNSNSSNSWSLSVSMGSPPLGGNQTRRPVFRMTEKNVKKHTTDGGVGQWLEFKFDVKLREYCPRRINIIIDGRANNDITSGWGVQLSEIRLENSWFERCQPSCAIREEPCAAEHNLKQFVDHASDFLTITSQSSNIQLDQSNSTKLFNGDTSRFSRSDNKSAEIVYKATKGIRYIAIEFYQRNPSTTRLELYPYIYQNCQPLRGEPVIEDVSGASVDNWVHKIAHYDLSVLPFCPTYASIHIFGGEDGQELQISSVNLTVLGKLFKKHRSTSRSLERPASTLSGPQATEEFPSGWWIWLVGFAGAVIVFLFAAAMLRTVRLCLGDDDRHIYHISNWLPTYQSNCKGSLELAAVTTDCKRAAQAKKKSAKNTSQKPKQGV